MSTAAYVTMLLVFMQQITTVFGAKILLMPMPHYSHINLFAVPGKALLKDGHDVWMLTVASFHDKVKNMGIKGIHYDATAYRDMENKLEAMATGLVTGEVSFANIAKDVLMYYIDILTKKMLSDKKLINKVEGEKFDLAIIDGFIPYRGAYALPYKMGIKYISLSALSDPWAAGVPAMPSFEPFQAVAFSSDMSFGQRFLNTLVYSVVAFRGFITPITGTDSYVKEFVPEKPMKTSQELYEASEMFLMNIETRCLDYPRLSAPHYVYIGGSSIQSPKPLTADPDMESFVSGADHGLIVLSFGSSRGYRSVVEYLFTKLVTAFQDIKQRVIMPCDPRKHPDLPANLKCVRWFPQNDLLGHEKTVLFITHGGNNGQLEAVYHGVPMLTLPLTTEQAYNGRRVVARGYGEMLDTQTFTSEELVDAIKNMLANSMYKEKIMQCSQIMQEYPSASEQISFWTNYILKYGGAHLKPKSIDLPMYKFLNLDIWFVVLMTLLSVIYFIFAIIRYCFCKCCYPTSKVKKE